MSMHKLAALALVLAACGGDDSGGDPPPKPATPPGSPAAVAAAAGSKTLLTPQVHVEDRASEAERASIRHQFKERDFATDQNRDPFQNYVVLQPGLGEDTKAPVIEVTQHCKDPKQMVASNYSYADLKLVGIVAQGTQRKVLMMDSGNLGHIIKRGDCVGKEKAVVKDIGTGYVTFQVESDPNASARPAEEKSIQLHPSELNVSDLPSDVPSMMPTRSNTPMVSPTPLREPPVDKRPIQKPGGKPEKPDPTTPLVHP